MWGGKGKAGLRFRNAALWAAFAVRCAAYHNLTWRSACSYQLCCAADVTYPVSVSRVPAPPPSAVSSVSWCRLVSSCRAWRGVAWRLCDRLMCWGTVCYKFPVSSHSHKADKNTLAEAHTHTRIHVCRKRTAPQGMKIKAQQRNEYRQNGQQQKPTRRTRSRSSTKRQLG